MGAALAQHFPQVERREANGTVVAEMSTHLIDGSGGTVFTAPGAPAEGPEGVVIDPETRTALRDVLHYNHSVASLAAMKFRVEDSKVYWG